jgi:heme exporter protein C
VQDLTIERAAPTSGRRDWLGPYALFTLAFLVAAQVYAVTQSVPERDMGHLQKILYVHVPAAWASFVASFVVLVQGVRVLLTGNRRADLIGAAAAEVGAVMTALTLVLGSIWGRPTWGVWWTWDARITSTFVQLLFFVGYLALRALTDDVDRRARWCAAVGILGAINVPIVYMSVRWWRTLHQIQSAPSTMDPTYVLGLRLNGIAFLLVLLLFIAWRFRSLQAQQVAEQRLETLALGGQVA